MQESLLGNRLSPGTLCTAAPFTGKSRKFVTESRGSSANNLAEPDQAIHEYYYAVGDTQRDSESEPEYNSAQ